MLITNGTVVTWEDPNRVLTDHAVCFEFDSTRHSADQTGRIVAVGPTAELVEQYPDEARLDARGQLIMPGNICAHTHFYGAYARGMAIPGEPPADFPAILKRLWWNLDQALDKDSVRASVLVSLVDAVKHGTTTLIDHHASPNFIDGSLDVIAEAMTAAGMRGVICYEVTDRNGHDEAEAGIAENVRALEQYGYQNNLIIPTFGLHASLSLSDETLRMCADAPNDGTTFKGYHVHVAEHEADEEDSLQRSGKRVVQRLDEFGMWNDVTIAAHCVHIDEAERNILRDRGVWVTHQPRSNMNNAVGAMAFDVMMSENMKICLGNDGFSNNMWAEWKHAYLLHKVVNRDPRKANGGDIARMAAYNNAGLINRLLNRPIGKLVPGAVADIILVDYQPFTPLTDGNLPWHILFGFEASMVTTTIINGQVLMRDRELLTLNEREIMAEALDLAPGVWERYQQYATNEL